MHYSDSIVSLLTGDVPALLYDDGKDAAGSQIRAPEYVINPYKSSVKFSWQPARFGNQFPFALSANQQAEFNVKVTPEDGLKGDVEVSAFLMTQTGRCSVQPYVPMLDKYIANVPLSSNLLFGSAQFPALLAQTLYSYPSVDWTLAIRDLTGAANTISPVLFGRRFIDRRKDRADDPRQAQLLSKFMHPYWIGPVTGVTSAGVTVQGGAEVSLAAGGTVTLFYPVPGDAAFDCRWILDDSTSTTGAEPILTAQIFEGDTGPPLNDVPMSWRDFLAAPTTLAITGMPSGGFIRAASTPSPGAVWSHLFEKSTKIRVVFTSADPGTITLRTAFGGVLIYAPEPISQQMDTQAGNIQARMARPAGGR